MLADEFSKYIKSQEFKDLLARYEQALLDDSGDFFDSDDLLDIAEYYHSKSDLDSASRACYYCLDLYPDNERALVFLGRIAIITGDLTTAERISESIKLDEELDVVYLRAELMLIKGDSEGAEAYLSEHFNMFESGDETRYDMALDVPLLYCDYSCWELAERWLLLPENKSQKEEIDYIEALAKVYTCTERQKEAIVLWNKYIDEDPFSSGAWVFLAQCQYQSGLCQEALQSAEYAIAINPDIPDPYLAAGNAYFSIGKGKEAIEMFERFLDIVPGDAQGELLLSCVYFSEENYEEAKVHIDNALNAIHDLTEDDAPQIVFHETYRQAAFIYSALGDIQQAINYIDHLLFYNMEEDSIMLLRAAIYLEAKQTNEAFEIFTDLLTNKSHDPNLYIQIGTMLVDSSFFALGYQVLSTTMDILKESGVTCKNGWDRLAYAALMEDHYDVFLESLALSVKNLPTETITIFSVYFPESLPIEQYVEYAKQNRISAG